MNFFFFSAFTSFLEITKQKYNKNPTPLPSPKSNVQLRCYFSVCVWLPRAQPGDWHPSLTLPLICRVITELSDTHHHHWARSNHCGPVSGSGASVVPAGTTSTAPHGAMPGNGFLLLREHTACLLPDTSAINFHKSKHNLGRAVQKIHV